MRAVLVATHDGPGALEYADVPEPACGDDEVLVDVRAVAPSFPDLLLSYGRYQVKPDLPFSPGGDFAGVVREAPAGSAYAPGDRVAGWMSHGAAAEVLSLDPKWLYPMPESMSFEVAAALPLNYLTAYFTLAERGGLVQGEWVLVTGAAGGVGLACVQVARGLGAQVIAVTSSEAKAEVARAAGAHHVIGPDEMHVAVRRITGDRGVDIAVDVVGGDMTNLLRSLAMFGRAMVVGFVSGEIPEVKVNRLLLTNTDVRGVQWGSMAKLGRTGPQWTALMGLVAAGAIEPVIVPGGGLEDFGRALAEMEQRRVIGRIVLTVG